MKKRFLIVMLISSLISAQTVMAEDAKSKKDGGKQSTPNTEEFDKQLATVQENMKQMQSQMEQIQSTKDLPKRQKLIQQHWDTMQSSMGMMRNMWGHGGMGCCMGGGHMMGDHGNMMGWHGMREYYSNLTPEQQKQRQYMMDQYMGMQQMMMDHMMQHQNWMMQTRPKN